MIDFLAGDLPRRCFTKAFLPAISATALIFMYWLSTFMSESRGMETNELGPLFGLDQHQNRIGPEARDIVYAAVIGGTVTPIGAKNQPSRGRRVGVSVSQSLRFSLLSTHCQAPKTERINAATSTAIAHRVMRKGSADGVPLPFSLPPPPAGQDG